MSGRHRPAPGRPTAASLAHCGLRSHQHFYCTDRPGHGGTIHFMARPGHREPTHMLFTDVNVYIGGSPP